MRKNWSIIGLPYYLWHILYFCITRYKGRKFGMGNPSEGRQSSKAVSRISHSWMQSYEVNTQYSYLYYWLLHWSLTQTWNVETFPRATRVLYYIHIQIRAVWRRQLRNKCLMWI